MSIAGVVSKKEYFTRQALGAVLGITAAVAVPQLLHVVGAVSGLGTGLGETFLPMHFPVILCGLFAGPLAGAVAGLLGPVVSHVMTGMPGQVMLPFMVVELFAYGLVAGLLSKVKMSVFMKVLIAQIAGRLLRAAVVLSAIYVFHKSNVNPAFLYKSIVIGLPGLLLQWSMIPLLMYRFQKGTEN